MSAAKSRMLGELNTVLLGRVTYTERAAYWPASTDEQRRADRHLPANQRPLAR